MDECKPLVVGHAMLVYGGYLEATADFTTQLWSYDLAATGVTAASAALPGGVNGWTKAGAYTRPILSST